MIANELFLCGFFYCNSVRGNIAMCCAVIRFSVFMIVLKAMYYLSVG